MKDLAVSRLCKSSRGLKPPANAVPGQKTVQTLRDFPVGWIVTRHNYAVLNVDTERLSGFQMQIQSIFRDISIVDSKRLSGYLKRGFRAFVECGFQAFIG